MSIDGRITPEEVRRMATSDLIMLLGAAGARADAAGEDHAFADDLAAATLVAACAEIDRRLPHTGDLGLLSRLESA